MSPAPAPRRTRGDGLSEARDAASFGRGVRWRCCSIGRVQWSIALSLPLGLFAILSLALVPSLLDGSAGPLEALGGGLLDDQSTSARTLHLGLVWTLALLLQCSLTQLLFTLPRRGWRNRRRQRAAQGSLRGEPHNHVTLTIGGVWMALPVLVPARCLSEQPLDDSNFSAPSAEDDAAPPSVLEAFGGASRVLLLWSLVLLTLGGAAMSCVLIETVTAAGSVTARSGTEESVAAAPAAAAIAWIDRPWIASGWMFCLQGFWQLLPLPQSLGRIGWSTAIGLLSRRRADEPIDYRAEAAHTTRTVRWWVIGFATAVLVIGIVAISLSGIDTRRGGQVLPLLAGLSLVALWLCFSIRSEDLLATQLTLAANGETGIFASRSSPRLGLQAIWRRWQVASQERQRTKQLLKTIQRERSEASDAARVDEILQRLHASGPGSLSNEERAILSRVSKAIRRERERDNPAT